MISEEVPFTIDNQGIDKKSMRVMYIQAITGLRDLKRLFDSRINETDVELIISHLDKKYNLSLGDTQPYEFIEGIFPARVLKSVRADYENFCDNMTTKDACTVILTKLLGENDIPASRGFPEVFNFSGEPNETREYNGKRWFPYSKGKRSMSYETLLVKIINGLDTTGDLYFHGTSWEGALSRMDGIDLAGRERITDFGYRNFYVTDTFSTACNWANRHRQGAVILFDIPQELLDGFENKLEFITPDDEWKHFIFRVRNRPRPAAGVNMRQANREYWQHIGEIDEYDYISGPICANPGANLAELTHVRYGEYIPMQWAFKEHVCGNLDACLLTILFFESL